MYCLDVGDPVTRLCGSASSFCLSKYVLGLKSGRVLRLQLHPFASIGPEKQRKVLLTGGTYRNSPLSQHRKELQRSPPAEPDVL